MCRLRRKEIGGAGRILVEKFQELARAGTVRAYSVIVRFEIFLVAGGPLFMD
ncbi:unnamed protein product [Rhodiola kirilowii]